jgi:signal transduction histidine kinase
MRAERGPVPVAARPARAWPVRLHWIDVAWVAFTLANLVAMLVFAEWETVPFHFIWVSLTVLYGFRVWGARATMGTLAAIILTTSAVLLIDVHNQLQPIDEITEVPLMSAMFLAMVWHARRRLSADEERERMYAANLRLLEGERRFVQDASHELRTPITVALGHAELLERAAKESEHRADARVVVEELTRLRRVADRLLLLAASEHPDFVHKSRIDVESVVLDALHRWSPVARTWSLGTLEEATVDADPDRLAVAVDALVENAVKHTTESGAITLGLERTDGMAAITVADSGSGIPPRDLDRIFDRFARSDAGRNRSGGGVGLGLAIVRTVAEAHGGRVAVRSTPGKGSVFELLIPLANGAGGGSGTSARSGATADADGAG